MRGEMHGHPNRFRGCNYGEFEEAQVGLIEWDVVGRRMSWSRTRKTLETHRATDASLHNHLPLVLPKGPSRAREPYIRLSPVALARQRRADRHKDHPLNR